MNDITGGDVRRIASVIRLKPEKREEYLHLHADPWPGVLDRLRACNIANYSIFLHGDLLFSYFEYRGSDFEADMALMAQDPVTQEWWKLTDPCQERLPGTPEGRQWTEIPSVFHMD
ncbi:MULTISPECIES: L-rhamnose mutarotase [unclassified Streptomyces]|uniref:L-rhamnose mutarotase n=1 Tax=unclassified Streptomyces TaxID=2593676 RepID=UPI0022565485|nr:MULTISPECIES: L-rhamnose mutarotase [unclassified Streptomyces]WSP56740.1 L-rhamnose mutarotase [Streptomyces sp. NBC_01241]WSU22542.1 L-rhamnose mutarotase [Streptomyces sp. NBC_01108]MCX4788494.1 L-rhamnose mutarotase [Streptomyces sp. NBC_01221]MCX4795746.1 L-rhamnose mutarotase [Streptomyces sp. NBC_01242]WSJ37033.1 L-rhamnose mutarotase [Streptomyces sp. NBC_01321]